MEQLKHTSNVNIDTEIKMNRELFKKLKGLDMKSFLSCTKIFVKISFLIASFHHKKKDPLVSSLYFIVS
jgi:hypothetical protein